MMPDFNWMHGFGWGGYGGVGWILNLIVTLGLLIGVVLLVVWLLRRAPSGSSGTVGTSYPSHGQPTPTAHEILQARYARGEISRDEYEEMRQDLGG